MGGGGGAKGVGGKRGGRGRRDGEGYLDAGFDVGADFGFEFFDGRAVSGGDEAGAEGREGVGGGDGGDLVGGEVVAGVVGGVAAEAQDVGFDEDRAAGGADFFDDLGELAGHFHGVGGGVEGSAFDAVGGGAGPEGDVGGVLFVGGGGVGDLVVLDDEDDRE